jgi:formylglycine-generating enzyme required for sulfatase activity
VMLIHKIIYMKRYLYISLFVSLAFCSFTLKPQPKKPIREGKDFALFFAVNDYQYSNVFGKLQFPITEAEEIAKELEDNYNFKTEIVRNPSYDMIDQKIKEYQADFNENRKDSTGQLLIFFTGHGHKELTNGYFLPSDANPKKIKSTAFSYTLWRDELDAIQCRHILIAIDACFSGSFNPKQNMRNADFGQREVELTSKERLLTNHDKNKTRLFFTAGEANVLTPDKSEFGKKFLEGLRNYDGADGILKSSVMFSNYLEYAEPKPTTGDFNSHQGAHFLFFYKNAKIDTSTVVSVKSAPDGLIPPSTTQVPKVAPISKSKPTISSLLIIKDGSYKMGNDKGASNQKPQHPVNIKSFYLSPYEVTFEEYDKYCKDAKLDSVSDEGIGRKEHPVINVSWMDAVKYCNWLSLKNKLKPAYTIDDEGAERIPDANGYRLPTEAEWEYAATFNPIDTILEFSGSNKYKDVAITLENSKRKSEIVGVKKPNGIGAYDMSGNVWEWVEDCYVDNYKDAPQDGLAIRSSNFKERVLRGGSYNVTNTFSAARYRYKKNVNTRSSDIGFRLARNL